MRQSRLILLTLPICQLNRLSSIWKSSRRDKRPHRVPRGSAVISFPQQKEDARTYASERQQRGLVLALRLAEFSYLRKTLGRIPLILANDVLGELDKLRKANFRKLLPPDAQVFATGTAYPSESESAIWGTF